MTSTSALDLVSARYPDLAPESGPGAAQRWRRLVRLAEVAQEYQAACHRGDKAPARTIADARGVATSTVRSWVFQAKQEGVASEHITPLSTVSDRVAESIKTARRRRSWSRERLAEECGKAGMRSLTPPALVNIESGRRRPDGSRRREISIDELVLIAAVLGVRLPMLLGDDWPCDACRSCVICQDAPPPGFTCVECGATTTKETA